MKTCRTYSSCISAVSAGRSEDITYYTVSGGSADPRIGNMRIVRAASESEDQESDFGDSYTADEANGSFYLGWHEIATNEADCQRFHKTLEPKCNGNEYCQNDNWGKYYECSERVNVNKEPYEWISG
ncbi:hypothetical protein HDU97_004315 [Phlyctochytrium planicorne]|nr:hypothetical protein HDU97_004315 [Phlyctochytrium planicorne]